MAAFLSDVTVILQIISKLNEINKAAEGNKERCHLLNSRCQCFKTPLEQLQQNNRNGRNEDTIALPLSALRETLSACVEFMDKFCQSGFKRSCLNLVYAKNIEKEFEVLNHRLLQSSSDLHFSFAIKQEIMQGEIAAAQRADEEHILHTLLDCMALSQQQLSHISQSNAGLQAKIEELSRQLGEKTLQSKIDNATAVMDAVHDPSFHQPDGGRSGRGGASALGSPPTASAAAAADRGILSAPSQTGSPVAAQKILAYATLHLKALLGSDKHGAEPFDPATALELGRGSFGIVYAARYEGEDVAVKSFGSTHGLSDREVTIICREAALMHLVNHQFILGMRGFDLRKGLLVMELAHASLFDVLHRSLTLSVTLSTRGMSDEVADLLLQCCGDRVEQCRICWQVASALRYLHFCDILHRDVKPHNILLTVGPCQRYSQQAGESTERSGFEVTAKLGDFGIAVALSKTGLGTTGKLGPGKGKAASAAGAAGTILYQAPELLDEDVDFPVHTAATDMYAFAITMNEVLSQQQPWVDAESGSGLTERQIEKRVLRGKRPDCFTSEVAAHAGQGGSGIPNRSIEEVESRLQTVVTACWAQEAADRMNASAVADELFELVQLQETPHEELDLTLSEQAISCVDNEQVDISLSEQAISCVDNEQVDISLSEQAISCVDNEQIFSICVMEQESDFLSMAAERIFESSQQDSNATGGMHTDEDEDEDRGGSNGSGNTSVAACAAGMCSTAVINSAGSTTGGSDALYSRASGFISGSFLRPNPPTGVPNQPNQPNQFEKNMEGFRGMLRRGFKANVWEAQKASNTEVLVKLDSSNKQLIFEVPYYKRAFGMYQIRADLPPIQLVDILECMPGAELDESFAIDQPLLLSIRVSTMHSDSVISNSPSSAASAAASTTTSRLLALKVSTNDQRNSVLIGLQYLCSHLSFFAERSSSLPGIVVPNTGLPATDSDGNAVYSASMPLSPNAVCCSIEPSTPSPTLRSSRQQSDPLNKQGSSAEDALEMDSTVLRVLTASDIHELALLLNSSSPVILNAALERIDALTSLSDADDEDALKEANLALTAQVALHRLIHLLDHQDVAIQAIAIKLVRFSATDLYSLSRILDASVVKSFSRLLCSDSVVAQEHTAHLIAMLVPSSDFGRHFVDAGGIEPLVNLLQSQNVSLQKEASLAVAHITMHCPARILKAGTMKPLIRLLESESEDVQKNAGMAISNIAVTREGRTRAFSEGVICSLINLARSQSPESLLVVVSQAFYNFSVAPENRVRMFVAGVVPPLIQLLDSQSADVQVNAARAIHNIAAAPENRVRMFEAGVVPPLIQLLSGQSEAVQVNAAGAIRNIAAAPENRVRMFEAGVMSPLIQLLSGQSTDVQRNAAGAILYIATAPENRVRMFEAGVLPPLIQLLSGQSEAVQVNAAGAILNIAAAPENRVRMLEAGVVPPLIQLLSGQSEALQINVIKAILNIAAAPENQLCMLEAGVVPPLIQLLASKAPTVQYWTLLVIRAIAAAPDNQLRVFEAGVVSPLLVLLGSKDVIVHLNAAAAIADISLHFENKVRIFDAGAVPLLVGLLDSRNKEVLTCSLGAIRNIAMAPENKMRIFDTGIIPPLIKLLKLRCEAVQERAAAAIGSISVAPANQARLFNAGVVPPLKSLLSNHSAAVQEQAAGALGNIALATENQVRIFNAGVVPSLIKLLQSQNVAVQERAVAAVRNIAAAPENQVRIIKAGAVPPLIELLSEQSTDIQMHAVAAIWSMALAPENQVHIFDAGVMPPLIELLFSQSTEIQVLAIGVIGNITSAPKNKTRIFETGVVDHLIDLLKSECSTLQERAAWVIGNIAAGSAEAQRCLSDARAVPPLIDLLYNQSAAIQKNAAWAIANIVEDASCAERIFDTDAVEVIFYLLQSAHTVAAVQESAMEVIGNLSKHHNWVTYFSESKTALNTIRAVTRTAPTESTKQLAVASLKNIGAALLLL